MSCGFGSFDLDRSVQGSIISQTLDQLSKDETWAWQLSSLIQLTVLMLQELLRFQEERRIAAMVKLAERDRQDRQAFKT